MDEGTSQVHMHRRKTFFSVLRDLALDLFLGVQVKAVDHQEPAFGKLHQQGMIGVGRAKIEGSGNPLNRVPPDLIIEVRFFFLKNASLFPLVQGDLSVHSQALGHQGSREDAEDAQVGDDEARLVFFPWKTGDRRAKDVDPQEQKEAAKPPSAVDKALGHHGGIEGFHDGSGGQKHRQDQDQRRRQLNGGQEFENFILEQWQKTLPGI